MYIELCANGKISPGEKKVVEVIKIFLNKDRL